jgi:hypothetical protein
MARRLAVSAVAGLGRRTVSGMLCAGAMQGGDWAAAYRIFERGRMDKEALFAPIREAVLEGLGGDAPLVAMMDDTLIRKRGRKVHGAGWKRDPLGPPFHTNFVWGQRFLQLSAALPDKGCPGRARGIPIDFIHAPSAAKPKKNAPPEAWEDYRRKQGEAKMTAVAAERLKALPAQAGGRRVVAAVDGGFTNKGVFRGVPEGMALVGRLRKDAKLFAVPEDEKLPRKGRRSMYGERLPTPEEVRRDGSVPWAKVEAFAAGARQQFEVKAMPAVRWEGTGGQTAQAVIVRPLAYRPRKGAHLLYRQPAYLICTDPGMPLGELLQAYLWRWEAELNFRDEKTVLGAGEAQVRGPASVEAVPAFIVAAYAFLLLAGEQEGAAGSLPRPKWQRPKENERVSTQQMQGQFRAELWSLGAGAIKTGFASGPRETRSRFYSENSLRSAVCYAFK